MTSRAAPRRLLVAGVGLCFTIAFLDALTQVRGLIGPDGIVPVGTTPRVDWASSPIVWLGASDGALVALCAAGAAAGALAALGVLPRAALLLAWGLHVSLVAAGSVFWQFQWDALLSEAGLLTVLVAPRGLRPVWERSPPRVTWVLVQLLLVRLMVASGAVKLLSGDPHWRDFSALRFHFWTQPLPTPLGIWVARAPAGLLDAFSVGTLAVELLAALSVLGPRRVRQAGAGTLLLFQLVIALTGNYGFFNLLSAVLVVAMLDDRDLGAVGRWVLRSRTPVAAPPSGWPLRAGAAALALLGVGLFVEGLGGPAPLATVTEALAPLGSFNRYGLFAVMTTERDEIRVEVSDDGATWHPLGFRYKPDDRGASWVAPAMPRLDWQMWFAALGPCRHAPWFLAFAKRLLEADPPVWRLTATPPPAAPPRFLRSLRRSVLPPSPGQRWPVFADAAEPFCPPLALRNGRLVTADVGPPGFEPGTNRL